jgi:AAA+ ATPase superfamily predicted ATPase
MEIYGFEPRDRFVNRTEDLARLEDWWHDRTRDALCMYGRRRVGKSWLFRRFADGKPAVVLVADERAFAPQFALFAGQIGDTLGLRPEIGDAAALIRLLYRLGRDEALLAVIDEFPFLLPKGRARVQMLSAIAAVMEEERDASKTKLLLCGSIISQMESLLEQRSPLHGRLQPLDVRPMDFGEAAPLLEPDEPADDKIARFSAAGGMARYLAELGSGGTLRTLVCRRVLDRRAPLFDDPRLVLERELREPATYFSLLEELARGEAGVDHLAASLGSSSSILSSYLDTLREMRLVSQHQPIGAPASSRKRKYRLDDGFTRFWFRFVFPHQNDLESGLAPQALWDGVIAPALPGHTAQTFEELCRVYARRRYGVDAPTVGGWWGEALPRNPDRTQEEIDVVGLKHKRLQLVGECKWTRGQMPLSVLDDLRTHKIPAIHRAKTIKSAGQQPQVLLFARNGFSDALRDAVAGDGQVELVDAERLVAELTARPQAEDD